MVEARVQGKLDWLLNLQPLAGQLSRADMDELTPDALARAKTAHKTDWATGHREQWTT